MIDFSDEIRDFIEKNIHADVRKIAFLSDKLPCNDKPFVLAQIAGRQIAAIKIQAFASKKNIIYPRHLSMEQCSSEITARYKAELISKSKNRDKLVDLTAGFGVDFYFMAQQTKQSVYVERQHELCEIAMHNFPILGLKNSEIIETDGIEYLQSMEATDWLFLDPARRDENGKKTVAISDCEPNICTLEKTLLEKGKNILIKLSPMLDIAQAEKELKSIREIHILSVENECKELLLLLQSECDATLKIHCINFTSKGRQSFIFSPNEEESSNSKFCDKLGVFLYEPNSSLMKAGAFRLYGKRFGLQKLHPNSHLYTSDGLVPDFPGRIFKIEKSASFSKKDLKELLKDVPKANLAVRNFPASVQELRKRLKIGDGNDIFLFATTFGKENKILIKCKKTLI